MQKILDRQPGGKMSLLASRKVSTYDSALQLSVAAWIFDVSCVCLASIKNQLLCLHSCVCVCLAKGEWREQREN